MVYHTLISTDKEEHNSLCMLTVMCTGVSIHSHATSKVEYKYSLCLSSSADPLSNMSVSFDSMEEAIAYAVKNGKYGSLRLLYSGILSVNHEKHLADVMYSGKLSREKTFTN